MRTAKRTTIAAALAAALAGGALLAQPAPGGAKAKPPVSAEMARAEAKVAQVRALVVPRPGEHIANMAKIAWERDPWAAAVKAAREGKPVLAYWECGAGVPCGYG
jgi:hypothetical protein